MKTLLFLLLSLPIANCDDLNAQVWTLLDDYAAPCTAISIDSLGNQWVARQTGVILKNGEFWHLVPTHYFNECGLVGILSDGQYLYLHVTSVDLSQRIVKLDTVDQTSHQLFSVPYTNPSSTVHHGGGLAIAGNVLFSGFGYGADRNDAQAFDDWRGKIIGTFLDSEISYIHAYGLRNPFKIAWEPREEELYVADVGSDIAEEVNVVWDGDNLGFPCIEGDSIITDTCGQTVFPIFWYSQAQPRSITGGVFRNKEYLWTDFFSGVGGRIDSNDINTEMIFPPDITGMAVDPVTNFLYVIAWDGKLYRYDDLPLAIDGKEKKKYVKKDYSDWWDLEQYEILFEVFGESVWGWDGKIHPKLPTVPGIYYEIAKRKWTICE